MSDSGKAGRGRYPTLTTAEMAQIADLLYRWTGMIFGENKRYYIERRIGELMLHNHIDEVGRYLGFVGSQAAGRQALINAFTINESYFYREEHQFVALSSQILPAIVRNKRPGDLVRIWSMPCSTGEEAYSIAIWLLENWALVDAYNVEIIGSDIDTAALEHAREGRFGARALARLPAKVIEDYFDPERGHRRKIIDDLRESVHFIAANIVDRSTLKGLGTFDVILCRNLLIYFDDASRLSAVNNLYDCLNPDGYICLGHSESMSRISDRFELVRLDDAIVYRKP
jgi:chemotaxis protein methyltransferase CheR